MLSSAPKAESSIALVPLICTRTLGLFRVSNLYFLYEISKLSDEINSAPIEISNASSSFRLPIIAYHHTGKLSCLRPGISTVFPRSIASARAMRGRVACGMITSSI